MEKSKEQSANSASGSTTKSKLRYPLRSALKAKDGKPPAPEFSGSSSSRRGRITSAVSQSTPALDLSAKDDESAKPTRRFSIPAKVATGNSACKSLSSLTPISESRTKRSSNARGITGKPVSSVLRSGNLKKVEDLSSATYWLSQIKLSESVAKHSISLGFFRLAQQAGCEPFQQMKEELKSYAHRYKLDELADATKELFRFYDIPEDFEQLLEEVTVSTNNDVQSSSSTPGNLSMMTPEVPKDDDASHSSTVTRTAKAKSVKSTPQGRIRRSLNTTKMNHADALDVQESDEGTRCSSDDGAPSMADQSSDAKPTNRKGAFSKNTSAGTRKLTSSSSANSRLLPETHVDKSQKKAGRTVNPKAVRNQEVKSEIKEFTKESVGQQEGQGALPEQMNTSEENKENSVVCAAEEIQVE